MYSVVCHKCGKIIRGMACQVSNSQTEINGVRIVNIAHVLTHSPCFKRDIPTFCNSRCLLLDSNLLIGTNLENKALPQYTSKNSIYIYEFTVFSYPQNYDIVNIISNGDEISRDKANKSAGLIGNGEEIWLDSEKRIG